ncbi:methylated-DNA--[protein]-cysteine S-methyltransferase [Ignavibacteria bacterium CHB1]|jgi:DNA-O6-methylguanine--protein-cysteine S-methyltransferase (EC 2.1.1.63)/Transcriptional regulator Ada|nr:MAG: bifunctional transcriptional activator/DNA repair protein Ada [Chlorobiota bacterium]MBW7856667.1 bifunctional transcriptional activator/DNA repair protein Ada [Ignavibacteria bacterium]MCE7953392.1 bifunctional transcriptional activator/DNA repair protein Ada [Chlorobi bacterium CHB7]MDL1887328.1 methylated-DNA--[protein]-cysteine S-methyltransferase [Ignavibacteria bacterium CHB1]OQY77189.1 MAG: XRE family transcriptional regulator [Ignavibacteriales bacterium UTCHB1]RIK47567.1 MAG: 
MTDTDIMYKALLRRDTEFTGIFFVGVKTTGIFCKPTCTAKKPKKENVEFFNSVKEALDNGYRPCKICKPLSDSSIVPHKIRRLLKKLESNGYKKISDHEIRKEGIDPVSVRKWFVKKHGLTFQAFQRMMRINIAFKKIREGSKVIDAAYDSGYESLSGFNEAYRKILKTSPTKSCSKLIINIKRISTPLGTMFIAGTEKEICLVEFTDRRMLESEFIDLSKRMNAEIIYGENKIINKAEKQLTEYFNGRRKKFTVPLLTPGTEFRKRVWKELIKIPYAKTISYKQQATNIGKPEAVRAVASANGHNRIAIIIPCHRVVGENGHLTGYGGGVWRKKWLIELEQKNK